MMEVSVLGLVWTGLFLLICANARRNGWARDEVGRTEEDRKSVV